MDEVEEKLAVMGMRRAGRDESGWYVTIFIDGERETIWATEDI